MRHRKKVKKMDRNSQGRKALFRSLATSLIIYEKVKTTKAKAKAIRPVVEKLITLARKNDLTARRELLKILYHKKAVDKTLAVLGPRYQERKGGYTRIVKIGRRQGDAAEMAQIEFV